MKRHLNTLFITTQGTYLSKKGEAVCISLPEKDKILIPIHTLGGIICFGQVGASPFLLGACAENQVGLAFLTQNGRFLARVVGPCSGNVLLRRKQYRIADDLKASAELARSIVIGKIVNCRELISRGRRKKLSNPVSKKLETADDELKKYIASLTESQDLNFIRGIEGMAAHTYFDVFPHLITAKDKAFAFKGRNRRPPLDVVNCLLSFVYTLLMHDVASSLEVVGLDPQVGFLHRDRPGRLSLALDMMEEFRPYMADRLVLSLINLGKVQAKDFKKLETGAVLMKDQTRKQVVTAYQKRKQEELVHPFTKEKTLVGMLWHIQALLMSKVIRHDLDAYPPFMVR